MLRVPTLIAFALQLCLLQLAWSGRRSAGCSGEGETSSLLRAAVIGVRAAREAAPGRSSFCFGRGHHAVGQPGVVRGARAVVLDGFLLPQVVFNAASGSRVKAISPWFYAGVTVIRVAPHAYDAFRVASYAPSHVYTRRQA
ncbi:hypothetical protein E2562_039077 [Oryza meyeriana var. granulata]|uniref:RING-type E3 ubiquitin transferase n=1 Tax=Oryza meyeriana var. granulata TaxID=110450 RepID=A0A6G1E7R8_9ORYZ|nr:hypothetical protein E2562_039077 [Oryza meyeriana var. granulata]